MSTEYKIRAVVTSKEQGYVVSASRLSKDNDIEIILEDEVGTLAVVKQLLDRVAEEYGLSPGRIDCFYNIDGKITKKPPRNRE